MYIHLGALEVVQLLTDVCLDIYKTQTLKGKNMTKYSKKGM